MVCLLITIGNIMKKQLFLSMVLTANAAAAVKLPSNSHAVLTYLSQMQVNLKMESIGVVAVNHLELNPQHLVEVTKLFIENVMDTGVDSIDVAIKYADTPNSAELFKFSIELENLYELTKPLPLDLVEGVAPELGETDLLALQQIKKLLQQQALFDATALQQQVDKMLHLRSSMDALSPSHSLAQREMAKTRAAFGKAVGDLYKQNGFLRELLAVLQENAAQDNDKVQHILRNKTAEMQISLGEMGEAVAAQHLLERLIKFYDGSEVKVGNQPILDILREKVGSEFDRIAALVSYYDKHEDLTVNYITGKLTPTDFAQQYVEFLQQNNQLFSAHQLQTTELVLSTLRP